MIYQPLLDERYDVPIMESLMYEDFKGEIKSGGKRADMIIYQALKDLEDDFEIKL